MGQKKKSGHKKSHKLYALTVIILGLAIIALTVLLLFYVQKIEIKGNDYVDSKEIMELVEKDKGAVNSLYLMWKYHFTDYEIPGNLESVRVTMKNPWTVQVTVKEKKILGYFMNDTEYVYFDAEGTVVHKGRDVIEGVPFIEGINISNPKLYQPLKSEDKKLFQSILELTQELKEFELAPDRIVCDGENLQLYFGEVCVALGTNISEEKMAQIQPILEKLGGEKGTLHLEHYVEESGVVSFEKGVIPEETEAPAEEEAGANS